MVDGGDAEQLIGALGICEEKKVVKLIDSG